MSTTLAESMADHRIDMATLRERYRSQLELVNILIGVVPNCDRYLEIWPPGFRTYNLMVPNFLNLPASLMSKVKADVGLGMYLSSRAASCAYCSAHTCSFALRRGSNDDAVAGASRTPAEEAVAAVAEGLSTMPHHYRPALGQELARHYNEDEAEWIVMGVAMMGFLNKFMDAFGVELEQSAVNDAGALIGPTGWAIGQHGWEGDLTENSDASPPPKDSLRMMLRAARFAPGALRAEKDWLRPVPKDVAAARAQLAEANDWDEPALGQMRHRGPARALAGMLHHNLDADQSTLGLGRKALVGLVFAGVAGNEGLAERSKALARANGVGDAAIAAVEAIGGGDPASFRATEALSTLNAVDGLDGESAAAVVLARETAPSPAAVTTATVDVANGVLTPAQIIEIVVWVSVCQLLHRLSVYYES